MPTGNNFRSISYDIFVSQKFPLWKNFDDVIACDLWFRPLPTKNSGYAYELEIAWKKILKNFFFGEHMRLCPRSLALASSIPVLGLERVCPRKGCPWPWPRIFFVSLALASSLVSLTPPLLNYNDVIWNFRREGLLMGQRYLRMKDLKRVPGRRVTTILLKRLNLNQKLKCFQKNRLLWKTWQANWCHLNVLQTEFGGAEAKPPTAGQFFVIFWKK